MNKEYPKTKYGTHTEVEIDPATGKATEIQDDVYNGGVTRRLLIDKDSIKIEDEKSIVEKVFDCYRRMRDGEILGFSVDADAYHPQTFAVKRMVVKTIQFADK